MSTTRALTGLFLAGLLAVSAVPLARAAAETPPPMVVQGEIVDLACYVAKGAKGEGHAKCAQACAKAGQPLGLLTAEGKVYLLYASHEDGSAFSKTKELAGTKVEVRGHAASRGGMDGLEVLEIKGL